jgi:hypothetical protein
MDNKNQLRTDVDETYVWRGLLRIQICTRRGS